MNRNKQVITLDIREREDREALDELLGRADVFLTNLRPGKLRKNALDAAALTHRYPRLIHASLSAYGDAGKARDRGGYDAMLHARTGIAEVTGTRDGPPVRAGVSVLDVGAGPGWHSASSPHCCAASTPGRERRSPRRCPRLVPTGSPTTWRLTRSLVSRRNVTAAGHPAFAPYGIFSSADRQVCLGVGGDELFRRLCLALDLPDLADDPRHAKNVDRVANNTELRDQLEHLLAAMPSAEVVRRLDAHGVACDVVQKPEDLLDDEQAAATDLFIATAIDGFGQLRFPGIPPVFDGTRPQIRQLTD